MHLVFVLIETARLIEQLRNEGRTVLLHCAAWQSGTPTVTALYEARKQGISGMLALQQVMALLPDAWSNSDFKKAIMRLGPELGSATESSSMSGELCLETSLSGGTFWYFRMKTGF